MIPKIDETERNSTPIPTRWNYEEWLILQQFKERIGIIKDNTAIKLSVKIANKVLQSSFPEDIVICLTRKTKPYSKEMKKIIAKKKQKVFDK